MNALQRGMLLFRFGIVVLAADYAWGFVNLLLYVISGTRRYLYWGILAAVVSIGISLCLFNLSKAIRKLRAQQEKL